MKRKTIGRRQIIALAGSLLSFVAFDSARAQLNCSELFSKKLSAAQIKSAANVAKLTDHYLKQITVMSARGEKPVFIFDLDETTINSRERALRILRDLALMPSMQKFYPQAAGKIIEVTGGPGAKSNVRNVIAQLAYNLETHPFHPDQILRELGVYSQFDTSKYNQAFYSSKYAREDIEMPGAAEFLTKLHDAGAVIVYLTGRPASGPFRMRDGTKDNILRNGFPAVDPESGVRLMMKPNLWIADADYKHGAFEKIDAHGKVIGGAENEPKNLNLMIRRYPGVKFIKVDSTANHNGIIIDGDVIHVRDFISGQR